MLQLELRLQPARTTVAGRSILMTRRRSMGVAITTVSQGTALIDASKSAIWMEFGQVYGSSL